VRIPDTPRVKPELRPLLRWAGGKQWLLHELLNSLPLDFRRRRYVEPFLGAASLFLALSPRQAILSDLNPHLVGYYRGVKDHPEAVWRALRVLCRQHGSLKYYEVREQYNATKPGSAASAARFMYLNRTGFNGVFRVNSKGEYNVPFATGLKPWFPDRADLLGTSAALRRARIGNCDFRETVAGVEPMDFVYLDPPYPATKLGPRPRLYTQSQFDDASQVELAEYAASARRLGAKVMISNADTPLIRHLFSDWRLRRVSVRRAVSGTIRRLVGKELIITSY
jgi:DNA adenine methylase